MNGDPEHIEHIPGFDDHHFVSFVHDTKSNLRAFIAIHRGGTNHPSFGATRLWKYASEKEAIQDVLRLSKLMSYKSAMAGLKYGGAKGVIIRPSTNGLSTSGKKRTALLKAYAEKVNYLGGQFITGTDVGLTQKDIVVMKKVSKYIVGVNLEPAFYTAMGLLHSIKACLKELYGNDSINGRSFAIQGMGKVGIELLKLIYKDGKTIYVTDIEQANMKKVKRLFPRVRLVSPSMIHTQKVDVYSPCALSHSLNPTTIPALNCKIVAGGANNQIQDELSGGLLYSMGILYAPDYVANAGGLISVADEYEHSNSNHRRIVRRVSHIGDTVTKILKVSKRKKLPTSVVADRMAEKIFNLKNR